MTAKERLQAAVREIVARGLYPGPLAIHRELAFAGHKHGAARHELNGREVRWRAEVLERLGWRRNPVYIEHEEFLGDPRAYKMEPNGTGGYRHNQFTREFLAKYGRTKPRYGWLPPRRIGRAK